MPFDGRRRQHSHACTHALVPPQTQVGHDHLLAAWTATLKQRKIEKDAASAGMTVEDFLRATNQFPCTDWKARPESDIMDLDYMKAFEYANRRERQREEEKAADERAAIAAGLTAEQVNYLNFRTNACVLLVSLAFTLLDKRHATSNYGSLLQYEEMCKSRPLPFTPAAMRMNDFEL